MTIQITLETITPAKAVAYLETMDGNRVVRQPKVDYWTAQMRAGLWRTTHQGIAFDVYGHLVDGQHRLWGVVESGVTVKMMVARGLEAEDVAAIDNGLVRDYSDAAHYQGWESDKVLSPAVKWLVQGAADRGRPVPHVILHGWYEFYRDGIDYALEARSKTQPARKKMTGPMTAAIARAYYSMEREALDRFVTILRTGQREFDADSAAAVLRDAWLADRLGGPTEQNLKTQGALRAFDQRRPIRTLQRPEKDAFVIPKLPKELRYDPPRGQEATRVRRRHETAEAVKAQAAA
jgi:hypothetical protein